MKVEYIKLSPGDLEVIIQVSQQVVDWKYKMLSERAWSVFETQYLPSLVEQLAENNFKVADVHKNTCSWLRDQILHSKLLQPGVKSQDSIPLEQTELGRRALEILWSASHGAVSYQTYKNSLKYQDLFTDK